MGSYWVGTGWKMNHLLEDAETYGRQLAAYLNSSDPGFNVFIVPPFTVLYDVCRVTAGSQVWVGAQNMTWEDRGALTGEISPLMVKDTGARLVEIGHSERRTHFGENDFQVNAKVHAALRHGLRPLICVGETAEEKRVGISREVVAQQTKVALFGVSIDKLDQVLLAYEPAWAIGEEGIPADPEYASFIHGWIREQIADLYGMESAEQVPVLYGGSVNHENAILYVDQTDIDGLFIGRAAWDPNDFIRIIDVVKSRQQNLLPKVSKTK